MDIGQLIEQMYTLYGQAEAQLQHSDQLRRSQAGWAAIQVGLRDTEELLRRGAGEVGPEWQDQAGDLYAQRMQRSSATVQAWQQTLVSANVGPTLTALADRVDTTFDGVSQRKTQFDALVAQLGQVAAGPTAVAAVEAVIARLRVLVEEAAQLLQQLDQAFATAAQQIGGASNGTPWDGPQAGAAAGGTAGAAGAEPAAAANAAAAGGTGSTAGPGSAADAAPAGGTGGATAASGGAGTAPGLAGGVPGLAGGVPGLAGVSAPSPVGVTPGGLPTIPSVSTPPMPTLPPLVPPGAALGSGSPGAYRAGRFGAGVPPLVGAAGTAGGGAIPRAGKVVGGVAPLAGAQPPTPPATNGPGTAGTGTGTGRMMPPMMMPPAGGGGGAAHTPRAATPDNRDGGHRNRPLRAVPGVPPRLRGRSGTLAGTPAFLGGAGRPTDRRDSDPDRTPELLDEELWQVEQAPAPVTNQRRAR
ncbi:hypothetical protein BDK92_6325 [Micromonospora pisi]|uniref:PPE family protein n=1 Tax=Micromonospora pisi TaxID=589240 RepID=A0A495JSD2_9ACTN|nr:hypothetical protein [Micromonospora pisi]RKR91897.1 hypothetical protein BDK92_6325 [Micromonospora pisi]